MNSNNHARNLRITQTPKAIRNNWYNEYTGKFTTEPNVTSVNLNNQKISTTYSVGCQNFYSFVRKNTKIDPNE